MYMLQASGMVLFILDKALVESPAKEPHTNLCVCHRNEGHADSGI
jgi:hypothetical protein